MNNTPSSISDTTTKEDESIAVALSATDLLLFLQLTTLTVSIR